MGKFKAQILILPGSTLSITTRTMYFSLVCKFFMKCVMKRDVNEEKAIPQNHISERLDSVFFFGSYFALQNKSSKAPTFF